MLGRRSRAGQVILNERAHDTIRGGRRRGHDPGDEVRLIILTGFGAGAPCSRPRRCHASCNTGPRHHRGRRSTRRLAAAPAPPASAGGPAGPCTAAAQTCRNVWTAGTSRNHGRSVAASTACSSWRPSAPMVAARASRAAAVWGNR